MSDDKKRLTLPQVTLCGISSVNIAATVQAMERSLAQIDFAAARLFTDVCIQPIHPAIEVVWIPRIETSDAYSSFLLSNLVDHIDTTHCMIVQWDGHVLDAARWQAEFLDYDYLGARWPQFDDDHNVGNGGFSLRSRQLMQLCRDPAFRPQHPEDIAIGRENRAWLEGQGMHFATGALADIFSTERAGDVTHSFGYHGAWLMPRAIGIVDFWPLYLKLDERSTIRRDFINIIRDVVKGKGGLLRAARLLFDQIFYPHPE